jgi:uncharacterized protein (DUF952 family)
MAARNAIGSNPDRVYKICPAEDWRRALVCGVYDGSPDDLRDGFVHLSTAAQAPGVLGRYFSDMTDLVAVAFEAKALGRALKWQRSGSGELYPHFYGPLPAAMAVAVEKVPDERGARAGFASRLA